VEDAVAAKAGLVVVAIEASRERERKEKREERRDFDARGAAIRAHTRLWA
jgi:hypothetical protein